MKKIILLTVAFCLVWCGSAFADNWYVTSAGAGLKDGTSYTNAWEGTANVSFGAGGVVAGDTLWVCGAITGQITGNFDGTAENRVVIRGDYPGDAGVLTSPGTAQGCIFAQDDEYYTVMNIKLIGAGVAGDAPIYLFGSSNNWLISNVEIDANADGRGIYLATDGTPDSPTDVTIDGCTIYDAATAGIQGNAAVNVTITNNTIYGTTNAVAGAGIFLQTNGATESDGGTITGNTTYENKVFGIRIEDGDNATISNNIIRDEHGDGIYIDGDSDTHTISGNTIYDFDGDGIVVTDSASFITVTGNTVYGGTSSGDSTGITFMQTANNGIVEYNKSYNNGHDGISAHDGNDEIMIRYNNIHGNEDSGVALAGTDNADVLYNQIMFNGNTTGDRAGLWISAEGNCTAENNILYNNFPYEIQVTNAQCFTDGTSFDFNKYRHKDERSDVTIDPSKMGLDEANGDKTCAAWLTDVSEEGGNSVCGYHLGGGSLNLGLGLGL